MEIKKVTTKDYRKLAQSNEYFFWHFLERDQHLNTLQLWSFFDEKESTKKNPQNQKNRLEEFVEIFPINIYESYTDESMDFLMDLGFDSINLFEVPPEEEKWMTKKEYYYKPIILLFKKYTLLTSTVKYCYCIEGLTDMIVNHAPQFLENVNLD